MSISWQLANCFTRQSTRTFLDCSGQSQNTRHNYIIPILLQCCKCYKNGDNKGVNPGLPQMQERQTTKWVQTLTFLFLITQKRWPWPRSLPVSITHCSEKDLNVYSRKHYKLRLISHSANSFVLILLLHHLLLVLKANLEYTPLHLISSSQWLRSLPTLLHHQTPFSVFISILYMCKEYMLSPL